MITKHDTIITAFAERASGPGWANSPIWVIVENRVSGRMRRECIQPQDQTPQMGWMYCISAAAHASMTDAVRVSLLKPKKRKKS